MDEVLGGADRQVVHHLQAAGDDPGSDDLGHCPAGVLDAVEAGQQHPRHLGLGQQLDGDFGDDAEHAFGAGEQCQQVETGAVQGIAAEGQAFALDREDFHLEQVVHGQAVLEAVHATGVLGDIAADGAGNLRGRVRRVVQAVGRGRLGDGQVAHAGLHTGEAALRVDFENAVEPRHHQQDAFGQWQGAARQAGTGAASHHRHATLVAKPEQRLHLLQALGQHHQQRHRAVGREAVAFIGLEVFLAVQDLEVRQGSAQRLQQRRPVHVGQRAIDAFVVQDIHRLTRQRFLLLLAKRSPLQPARGSRRGRVRGELVLPVFAAGTGY
ncbi:hypothetical protein D3C78_250040 [compost metagenome]